MAFTVITAGEDLPPRAALALALGRAHGLDPATAAAEARHCWGLLGSGLPEARAEALAAACAEAGVPVLKLALDGLPALPIPRPARAVSFSGGKALFTGPEFLSAAAAPADILVLAAAPIKEEFFRTTKTTEGPSANERAVRMGIMAVTGLPIGLGKSREVKKEVKSSEVSFYMDLLLAGGVRLRLASDGFDFSALGEKKTYSSQVNFRLLCAALADFAPGAFKNAGLKAILGGGQLAALPYDGLADLEKETLRLSLAKGS